MPGAKHKASHDQPASDGLVVLHRSRFVEWQPAPVVSLAASHDGSLVAAVRESGDIELYDSSTWHCTLTLHGSAGSTTTCAALVDEDGGTSCRLFTAGLDGTIQEQDMDARRPCASCDSFGGAVWQLVPEPLGAVASGELPRLAAACDDGCVRLFSVDVGVPGAAYAKSLPRVEGRVLAVAWHPEGKLLASVGTDGCIHVWQLDGNRELLRITAGDTNARRDFCVWDLRYLPDGTLVSADSDGGVKFWDGSHGTLLRGFQQHQADVLRLAAAPDGRTVWAAGVDPQLAVFTVVQGSDGSPKWAFLSSKRPHTHDVRAMCVVHGKHAADPVLLTGSNDTQLLAHSAERFLKEHPHKLNPVPQRPLCQASQPAPQPAQPAAGGKKAAAAKAASAAAAAAPLPPRLLCSQRNQLDLWQLGTAAGGQLGGEGGEAGEGGMVPPGAPPLHLARFQTKGGRFLTAAALAPSGDRLAFSDTHRVRAFQVAERPLPGGEPAAHAAPAGGPGVSLSVTPLRLPADLPPASHLAFLPGSGSLVACALDGMIRIIDLSAAGGGSGEGSGSDAGAAGAAGAAVLHVIRDVHDLRHKLWARRERFKSAARRVAPAVDVLTASPDGKWLAVAARQRVHLIDLRGNKPSVTQLPPPCEPLRPVTALAFTADSAVLLAATSAPGAGTARAASPNAGSAACQLAAYDVATGQPSAWAQSHGEELARKLAACPGPAAGLACSPASPSSFLLHSPAAICHVDMAKPLFHNPYHAVATVKRRRGPSRPVITTQPAGENCRVLYGDDPVLHVQYLGPDAVLVVERAWSDVWQKMGLAPMYRHRYGT